MENAFNTDLFEQKFAAQMGLDRHITENVTIILAISGGVDSMVLAHLLIVAKLPFQVAHVNFKLRGVESDLDADFVKSFAAENALDLHFANADLQAEPYIKKGVQEAARNWRYDWFAKLCFIKKPGVHKVLIATAHHRDDVVETMLFRMFRGTGIGGLEGIPAKRDNIIRPLLFADKKDILQYAQLKGIKYREDSSNASNKYARNAIRNIILPVVEQHFPNAKIKLLDTARIMEQTLELFSVMFAKQVSGAIKYVKGVPQISTSRILTSPFQETFLYHLFSPYGFTVGELGEIPKLCIAKNGAQIISNKYRLIRHGKNLLLMDIQTPASTFLLMEKIGRFDVGNMKLIVRAFPYHKVKNVALRSNRVIVDSEKLKFPIIIRNRKEGDYFYPEGLNKKKKVGRYLIDLKLPLHEKEKVLIMESCSKIVWLPGYRMDGRFMPTSNTKQVYIFEIIIRNADA